MIWIKIGEERRDPGESVCQMLRLVCVERFKRNMIRWTNTSLNAGTISVPFDLTCYSFRTNFQSVSRFFPHSIPILARVLDVSMLLKKASKTRRVTAERHCKSHRWRTSCARDDSNATSRCRDSLAVLHRKDQSWNASRHSDLRCFQLRKKGIKKQIDRM